MDLHSGQATRAKTMTDTRALSPRNPLPIFFVSSFTATPVKAAVGFWTRHLGIPAELSFGAYGQVFQELSGRGRGGAPPTAEVVVVLLRMEDFLPKGRHKGAVAVAEALAAALDDAAHRSPAAMFLVAVCPASLALRADPNRLASVDEATRELRDALHAHSQVRWTDPDDVLERYRVGRALDSYADELGHIPYTPDYFAALGTTLVRRLHGLLTVEPKVVVIDGDNTLWDGILGEDGVTGVSVGPGRRELQDFLLEQRRAGRLLCLCTKNDPADVSAALTTLPGMRLAPDDFVDVRANWSPKSTSVRAVAQDLGLALDSFVFVDDSPLECAEVRARCPKITTVHLPPDGPSAVRTLRNFWPLDVEDVTTEAAERNAFYQRNRQRRGLLQESTSLADFLEDLELEVIIRRTESADHPRMVELMRRTTQFNLNGERYSAGEFASPPRGQERRVVEVRDRFGTYGTVGLLLFSLANRRLTVTTFLLSCRALGRGVEHRMTAYLGEEAMARGIDTVRLRYAPTARNLPARQFLDEVAAPEGDDLESAGMYVVRAEDAANTRYTMAPSAGRASVPVAPPPRPKPTPRPGRPGRGRRPFPGMNWHASPAN